MSYTTLFRGEATFVVDGSFFPNRSELISAAWFLVSPSFQKLAISDFITTVAMDFHHPFASEICSTLSIFFFIDKMFQSAPINTRPSSIEIQLGSDCQAVIDNLWDPNPIVSFFRSMHQIVHHKI